MCAQSNTESSRPVTPSEEDCCHNDCNPCIFDIHKKLIEAYEKKKKHNLQEQNNENIINPYLYENFIVTDVKKVSSCYILLYLKYQENNFNDNKKILINPGQYVMLQLCNTTRSFTPISFTDDSIEFLIRIYINGKFSTFLRNIRIGDQIRVRGPYGNFKYQLNSFQKIVMFTMGSGITAVYSVAKSIIHNELEETKVHLIGGFENVSQIPLTKELQILSDYWNFKCTLYISQLHNDVYNLHGINIKSDKLNKRSVTKLLEDYVANTTLVLICGNNDFNNSVREWVTYMDYTYIYVFD